MSFEAVGVPLLDAGIAYPTVDGDNSLYASAVGGEAVRVWDVASCRPLGDDLPFAPLRIAFSEDGSILAVPTEDQVTLWNFDTDTWDDIACEVAGRNMTAEEWEVFGPRTIERRATCDEDPLP